MLPPFRNEPLMDFRDKESRAAMARALDAVRSRLGEEVPLIVGGRRTVRPPFAASRNPSRPEEVVAYATQASPQDAAAALEAAWAAFPAWSRTPASVRARYLLKAAAVMRARRLELAAWICLEAGKTWPEADADVAEAIDFLEYYAREAVKFAAPLSLHPLPDEEDEARYLPLGAGVLLPPWNFPLAIVTGMTAGPVAAGNTVVLKPASPTPAVAARLMEVLEEASLPPGVVNFVPGEGHEVGDALVTHPRTRFVSFTGSRDVGLRIHERAARLQPGQRWIKRVVAEMGGKDAIVVDETADLEAACRAIVVSAYGYQGQKCSACSRAIVLDPVYDRVLDELVERTRRLTVGPATDPDVDLGPVIHERALRTILGYIEVGKQEGRLVLGGERAPGSGYFLRPTVFADVHPRARIAQEEIFGPVLAVLRARTFEEALDIANATPYGLTGAVFSRDRRRLERARAAFEVGNLYLNRGCTGAKVGAHPFGGLYLSGTDAKAGGPDYLLHFLQMKAVAERF